MSPEGRQAVVSMTECACGYVIAPTSDGRWVVVGDPEFVIEDHDHAPDFEAQLEDMIMSQGF